jgi:hypothetical protein
MQCPFSIRDEVLSDVNCQLRGFDDEVENDTSNMEEK